MNNYYTYCNWVDNILLLLLYRDMPGKEYRKIIKFGKSSYVISLPKPWLEKNNLAKGDSLQIEVNKKSIVINKKAEKDKVEVYIDGSQEVKIIEKQIISSYIENSDKIIVKGNLKGKIRKINKVVEDLIAAELIKQTSEEMVIKSFLDIEEVNHANIIKKVDHIINSIFADIESIKESGPIISAELCGYIEEKNKDVNKLCFLILRKIDHRLKNDPLISVREMMKAWNCAYCLEDISNELKNTAKELGENTDQANILYRQAMKAYYTGNDSIACKIQKSEENERIIHKIKKINKCY